ncbi:hypothetical protein PWT90_09564 [Aphanocladium album]|nr:hypothetical protein PWT90_09564 [Aphanocladium album]
MSGFTLLPVSGGTMSPQTLDPDQFEALDKALSHLLATEAATQTLAQLMDGLPLLDVSKACLSANNLKGSPLKTHTKLCSGSLEKAEKLITDFNATQLQYDPALLQEFQRAELGSDTFLIRLLELVARAIHCIAVSVDKTAEKCHDGNIQEAIEYHTPPEVILIGRNTRDYPYPEPPASPSCHANYTQHEQYPNGASELAGFWAEDQIFGGVVLFDRGDCGTEAKSVWLHSSKHSWTTRIWKPLEWQMRAMKRFFETGRLEDIAEEADEREKELARIMSARQRKFLREPWKGGFPFFCDMDNPERHDDWDAMKLHNIYKDEWERSLPDSKPDSGPLDTFNYPELQSMADAIMYAPDITYEDANASRPTSRDRTEGERSESKKRKRIEVVREGQTHNSRVSPADGQIRDEPRWTDGDGRILIGQFDGKTVHYANDNMKEAVEHEKDRVTGLREATDAPNDSYSQR